MPTCRRPQHGLLPLVGAAGWPDTTSHATLQALSSLSSQSRIAAVPGELLEGCASLHTLNLRQNPITVEELRQTRGWEAFDARRRARLDKQLQASVLDPELDEGADVHAVQNWK